MRQSVIWLFYKLNIFMLNKLIFIMEQKIFAEVKELARENGFKCNAAGRKFIADKIQLTEPRAFSGDILKTLQLAEEVGGCKAGEEFEYINAQGGKSVFRVCELNNIPKNLTNPVLVGFSGTMALPTYLMEAVRFYAKQTGKLLPLLLVGKEGNKGLFGKVFDRTEGLMIEAENKTYMNILELMAPSAWVRENARICQDTDTAGNLDELAAFARAQGKEVTFILCTGQPWYDKRVVAEFAWHAREEKYKDVKMNFVLIHCPLYLNFHVIDGRPSELSLGYAQASVGPLCKDTIGFDGTTESAHPERFLMPGVKEFDWGQLEELIKNYANMGWPNYEEILFGSNHEDAVTNVLVADLYARASFTEDSYDEEIRQDVAEYQKFAGVYDGGDFLTYLKNTPDTSFFNR